MPHAQDSGYRKKTPGRPKFSCAPLGVLRKPDVTTSTTIVLFLAFLAFGACFGVVTFSRRHLFSEGPSRAAQSGDEDDTFWQRLIWVLSCSALWPLMLLTGAVSLWRLRGARVRQRRDTDR
jgi:hypothetical protein